MGELNIKVISSALLGGIAPALIWLWFWLKEDKERPEPKGLLTLVFLIGAAAVIFVLPLERLVNINVENRNLAVILWASLEEIIKYVAVFLVIFRSPFLDEPVDYPIYLITAALGFAALENTLFLLEPLSMNDTAVSLINGNLRFLGATLLHAVSSGAIGAALGLSFYKKARIKGIYLACGLVGAIGLHSVFNFFIMDGNGEKFFLVFGFIWTISVIGLLIFEKLRRMSGRL